MPINLQIRTFKRIFLKANTHYEDDPSAEMDNIDWEKALDSTLGFEENLQNLEQEYPQYLWRVPKRNPKKAKQEWRKDLRKGHTIYTKKVEIKSQKVKTKGRVYVVGRIQVTTDKKWVGRMAKILVRKR
jgi:hypothetical protein